MALPIFAYADASKTGRPNTACLERVVIAADILERHLISAQT